MAVDLSRVPPAERADVRKLTQQSEADLQQQVVDFAIACGWGWPDPKGRLDRKGRPSHHGGIYHTRDSRGSAEGFPDLIMLHLQRRLLFVLETKREKAHLSLCQEPWLRAFSLVFGNCRHLQRHARVFWGDPTDWPEIERVLRGQA